MKFCNILLASAAFCTIFAFGTAHAETVTTTTVVTQKEVPNVRKTDLNAFDLNHDNILSIPEVGTKLFYLFDTDGNEVIDNVEFNNANFMTIIPMQEQTFTFVDSDSDGKAESSSYTYNTFFQESRLARFDKEMNGLSPADFIGSSFLELDDDNSKVIELPEWKEAYTIMVHAKNAEPERYN